MSTQVNQCRLKPLLSIALVLLAMMTCDVGAATIVADGTTCTLVDAITAANTNAATGGCRKGDDQDGGGDIIDLRTDVTLTAINNTDADGYGNGLPAVIGALKIRGNDHVVARSSTDGTPAFRLFDASRGDLTLERLSVKNGYLHVPEVDRPPLARGAGILGTVRLISSTVADNMITGHWGGGNGAGISGTATLLNSTVSGNQELAAYGEGGGGIYGTATLTNSTVSGNVASSFYKVGTAAGGGILGTATLIDSSVTNNWALVGGGLYGRMTLTNSAVTGNKAECWGYAGAGGIGGDRAYLTNSTVSGNAALSDGPYGEAYGGGIAVAELSLIHSTISGNHVQHTLPTSTRGGGISAASSTMLGSVIAGNTQTDATSVNGPSDCEGSPDFIGISLIGDGSCGATAAGQLSGDPKLGALADNGGPTRTHALLAGSPAIDRIDFVPGHGCADSGVTTDQRGTTRPQPAGGKCDIGAFELSPNAPRLLLSKQPNRSNPVSLEGNLLVGNTFVFTTPDTGVAQVEFRLDGTYVRTEKYTPFDFASTAADGSASPFNAASLAPGSHSITARVTMSSGAVQTASGTFDVPGLYLSYVATRSNPLMLKGLNVPAGNLYIFAGPEHGLKRVQFWLDGRWVKTENLAAFDLAGTAGDGTAYPFDGGTLTPGSHLIKALLTLADGSTSKIYATFVRQ